MARCSTLCTIIALISALTFEDQAAAEPMSAIYVSHFQGKTPARLMLAQSAIETGPSSVQLITRTNPARLKAGDRIENVVVVRNAVGNQRIRLQNSNHGASYFTGSFAEAVQSAVAAVPAAVAKKVTEQQMEIELPAGSYTIDIIQTVSDRTVSGTLDDAPWADGLQLQVDWLLSTAPSDGMPVDRGHAVVSKWIDYQLDGAPAIGAVRPAHPSDARWSILRSIPNVRTGDKVTFEIHETNYSLSTPTRLRIAQTGSSTASDADFVQGLNEAVAAAQSKEVSFDSNTGFLTFDPETRFPFRFVMTARSASSSKDYVLQISDSQIGQIDVATAGVRLGELGLGPPSPMLGVNQSSGEFGVGAYWSKYAYPGLDRIEWSAKQGFKIIRIPFRFGNVQKASGAPLDEAALRPLDATLAGCATNRVVCLLDMHDYGTYYADDNSAASALPGTPNVSNLRLAELWAKIASRYRDNPWIWFDLMNEPHQQTALEWVKTSNAISAAIRAAGAKNKIVFSGTAWDGAWSWTSSGNSEQMLKAYDPGNNFAFEAHQYLDGNGSGTSPTCAAGSGATRLAPFTAWLRAYGLHGIIGEVGWAANSTCDAEASALLETWRSALATSTAGGYIALTYWANGPWWPDSYMYLAEPRPFPLGSEPSQLKALKKNIPR